MSCNLSPFPFFFFFFFNDTAPTEIYPLPLPDALPIPHRGQLRAERGRDVPEPRQLDPALGIEGQGAIAADRDPPLQLEHRHHAPDVPPGAHPIGPGAQARALFQRGDALALYHHHISRCPAEGEERLDLPAVRPAQRRRRFQAHARERTALRVVPGVVLGGGGDPPERSVEGIQHRAQRTLELPPLAQATLVDRLLVAPSGREHDLVLGVRLLGEEVAGDVELARGPAGLPAQGARVAHHGADLLGCRCLAEGRHIERQTERRPALRDDADPAILRLGRARLTVAQVGRRDLEPCGCRRHAASIGAVTGCAPGGVQRGAVAGRGLEREQRGQRRAAHASPVRRRSSAPQRAASRTTSSRDTVSRSRSSTTARPSTKTSRTSLGWAAYTRCDTGSGGVGARCGPRRSSTTRSARRPTAIAPSSSCNPRARAPPAVASSSTWPADRTSAPWRGFWISAASRISANASRRFLHAAPSQPRATRHPAWGISRVLAPPPPRFRFD